MDDICLVHQAFSCLDWDDIDTSYTLFGKSLGMPLVINAMTGGSDQLVTINRGLAKAAKARGVAMAVGSQSLGLKEQASQRSFRVTREENPDGVIIANVSAISPVEDVVQAVDMLNADAVQLHLNLPQELSMEEGDRNFSSLCRRVTETVNTIDVPVIVKEVGFGISKETAMGLAQTGVRWLDLGGKGGTNFAAIEARRFSHGVGNVFLDWGITTVCSLLEVKSTNIPYKIFASGGIRSGLDIAKALVLGADAVGIAGPFLKALLSGTYKGVIEQVMKYENELKTAMLLTGSASLEQLKEKPWVISGNSREWCRSRGVRVL